MHKRPSLRLPILALALTLVSSGHSVSAQIIQAGGSALATVSGTIRRNGSPLAGVHVWWWSGSGVREQTTGGDGRYRIDGVSTGGWIHIHIRPPVQMRLEYRNCRIENLSGDLVKDFDLAAGYLLSGEAQRPDGQLYGNDVWLHLRSLEGTVPEGEWLGDGLSHSRFEIVLAPGIYRLDATMSPFFLPRTVVDLRSGDQTGVVVRLLTEPEPPFPTAPPRADRITVGPPDVEGYATVSGAAGSVMPWSGVAVVNLSALNLVVTHSDPQGAFSARLYAPPGSSLWIKYDPDGWRAAQLWAHSQPGMAPGDVSYTNPLPGTIVTVGTPGTPSSRQHHFSTVGALRGPAYEWGGWWVSGTLTVPSGGTGPGLMVQRGDQVQLSATVRMTSAALNCSGTPEHTPRLRVDLRNLFDAGGWAEKGNVLFSTDLFTPTGLPIEREGGLQYNGVGSVQCTALACISQHAFEGSVDMTFRVPGDLPDGTYGVVAWVDGSGRH